MRIPTANVRPENELIPGMGVYITESIVGNERFNGLGNPSPPILYLPLMHCGQASMSLLVRTRTDPLNLAKPVQEAIWEPRQVREGCG